MIKDGLFDHFNFSQKKRSSLLWVLSNLNWLSQWYMVPKIGVTSKCLNPRIKKISTMEEYLDESTADFGPVDRE